MIGFVYAIRSECGLVKIGWSSDPQKRLAKVQSDTPRKCALAGAVPESREYEAALHRRFSPWKVRGEWFREDGLVAEFVAGLPQHIKPAKPRHVSKLGTYLSEHGITHADFATRIGTSQAAVTRYVLEQRTPRPDVLSRIMSITSGEVTANDFMPGLSAPQPQQGEVA